jgi:hypothetical protein
MLILTALLAALAGCATKHGSGATSGSQGAPFQPAPPNGKKELTGAEWLRDTLYDATIHGRGRPDDYNQPIYMP